MFVQKSFNNEFQEFPCMSGYTQGQGMPQMEEVNLPLDKIKILWLPSELVNNLRLVGPKHNMDFSNRLDFGAIPTPRARRGIFIKGLIFVYCRQLMLALVLPIS